VIQDNVWLGRNVIVRGGVTIGEGAVVGHRQRGHAGRAATGSGWGQPSPRAAVS
jgi:acetyltransferase-like isoleucine patch superfamily enzyme